MARSYGKIANSLWASRKWKALKGKDRPRLLYLFFHTCPQRNSIGCFPCAIGYVASDLGWGENQVLESIEKLKEVQLIDWNTDEEIVRIVDFINHDPPMNLKHAESMAHIAMTLPGSVEKARVLGDLLQSEHGTAIQGLSEAHATVRVAYPYSIEHLVPLPRPLPKPTSLRSDSAGAPRTKLPGDWPTAQDQDNSKTYWLEHGRDDLVPRLQGEITKARAHHLGKGTRSADWSQSWVTWYTRAMEYTRAPAKATSQFPTAKILSITEKPNGTG